MAQIKKHAEFLDALHTMVTKEANAGTATITLKGDEVKYLSSIRTTTDPLTDRLLDNNI